MNTLVNELSLIFARLGIDTYGAQIDVFDPWVDKGEAKLEYDLDLIDEPEVESYDAVVLRSLPAVEMTTGMCWA